MNKREQITAEALALLGSKLDESEKKILEEKLMDMWRETMWETQSEWGERLRKYGLSIKTNISTEQYKEWDKSHAWYGEDESDTECSLCHMTYREFFECPEFCEGREVDKKV